MTTEATGPTTHPADGDNGWADFEYGPWEEVVLPRQAPSEALREELDLPRGIRPIDDDTVTQQPVFDPALAGYARALRPSEPAFADPEVAARWLTARREALNTVLSAVARSAWAEHLVLRGSILLRGWYGEAAREPGDLDFVVVPTDWELEDDRTERMIHEIAAAADRLSADHLSADHPSATAADTGLRLHADRAVADEIWTYSRVPGRRLVLPWTAPGVPGGTVQLDFVFTEHLPLAPRSGELPGVSAPLLTATPELSLAWKILWLLTDNHPQGKDLYDAVLLARDTQVSYELLHDVFAGSAEGGHHWPVLPSGISDLEVDWDEFRKDYPTLAEPWEEYPSRLLTALTPAFGGRTEYELRAAWLAPFVEELRPLLATDGMAAVLSRIAERYLGLPDRLVVTRELLSCDFAEAVRVAAGDSDADWRVQRLREAADRFAAESDTP
ncbi:nucleotidyl transferase AbiEii/AbiGii toxin family protein [Kitasatospora sp. MBT63]|uniref:nucleotidyl transferase AbiEii/AbiGii toxin family protein n=1 Tax=Kitasatospora sp. MBT63 TaxID=1444768 RepID=UPI0007C7355F|nr:nucleotidyl transferase AbiEii/AbiGii toxin family protein [Kitasatospora sp. MBT63]